MKQFQLIAVFTAIVLVTSAFAQDNIKTPGNDAVQYYYSNGNGSTQDPMLTPVQPAPKQVDAQKLSLLKQLRQERLNNNSSKASEIQNKLNEIDGFYPSNIVNDPSKTGILETEQQFRGSRVPFLEQDYSVSNFNNAGLWSIATTSSNRAPNKVFAVVTEYVAANADNFRAYVSYNGGATWILKSTFNGFAATVDFRPSELDCEVIINAGDTMLYAVAGYTFNAHALSLVGRFNIGTGANSVFAWSFGGALATSNNTYNPRVTSDNTLYTSNAYVYITVSADSSIGGSNVKLTQRFAVMLTPYGTMTPTYRIANAGGGGFWWYTPSTLNSNYLWQDICFYDASAIDRVYTVYNYISNNTLYIAWSNDYGATNTGSISIGETAETRGAIVEANGGTGNQTLCIAYRRFFGPDWDYRGQFTTTGGTTTGAFTNSYIEFTTASTAKGDIQAVKNTPGKYIFAWAQSITNHYYRQTNNSGTSFTTALQTNNIAGDTTFGSTKAGYRPGGGSDSCLVIWSSGNGTGANCSYLICSTVGINNTNSEVPEIFSLSQNYPNPFNPSTMIRFAIPSSGLVKLVVYDIMGREVRTLVNQNMNPGNYQIDFDGAGLSSGIYFYKLTSGSYTDTKKMMLVK